MGSLRHASACLFFLGEGALPAHWARTRPLQSNGERRVLRRRTPWSNVGRNGGGQEVQTRDVQRCESVPSQARPDYWDVTCDFRGQEHRIQMAAPPGPTVKVNERGEPRE